MRRRCSRAGRQLVNTSLSAGISLSVGIAIVSLLLRPVAGYAAEAARPPRAVAVPASDDTTGNHQTAQPSRANAGKGAMAASTAARGTMVRLPGHILDVVAHTPPEPKAPGADAEPLTLTLVLNRTDQAGFERYLHDVYDPQSPTFRHFLGQRELSRRFGPSRQAYEQLQGYLRATGFQLAEGSANRLTLTMRGPRAAAERAFDVHIRDYSLGSAQFYANDDDPALPRRLASSVHSVSALSNYQDVRRAMLDMGIGAVFGSLRAICDQMVHSSEIGHKVCELWCLAAGVIAEVLTLPLGHISIGFGVGAALSCIFYDPLLCPNAGCPHGPESASRAATPPQIDGTGQTIGLLEFSNFNPSDVQDYLALLTATGFSPAPFANLLPADCPNGSCPGKLPAHEAEVLLDIDAVMLLAPGAQVAVYEAPWGGVGSFVPLLNRMINGGVSIISNSWVSCENHTAPADARAIDTVLQQAAAAGISVFNASGDWGGACNDGSPNTVLVPADSPNATAVGGSSYTAGLGYTYGSEAWWDGTQQSPAAPGQGGFGESKFFARPSYQNGVTTSAQRSVPDVVVNADPKKGLMICQADRGGCPTGLFYGGTSFAAPQMAAYTARLNQSLGHNIGAFNQAVYPVAKASPTTFHNAESMHSDIAHVGLGSPNLDVLSVKLAGVTVGAPDPAGSRVAVTGGLVPTNTEPLQALFVSDQPMVLPADGSIQGVVVVELRDANGHAVSGKTVTLAASGGSAQISPASGVSSVNNGAVAFTVTDMQAETVTFTATDTTDGIPLSQTASITFAASAVPATAFGLDAGPTPVTNNGTSTTWITATLQDVNGRPAPGKEIRLSQGSGHSVISGPIPAFTDANGQVVFTATDQVVESVTYSAVDVTDGNVPFPTTATVAFINGSGNSCGTNEPVPAPGFAVTPYATGFDIRGGNIAGISVSDCPGANGMAFDTAGNLYVSDFPTGKLYKFPPGGGVANSYLLTTIAPGLAGLAYGVASDGNAHLYAARVATTNNDVHTGAIQELDLTTGTVMQTVASQILCPGTVAIDPLSGDLFTSSTCYFILFGGDDSVWRISNPLSGSPTRTKYPTTRSDGGLPGLGNLGPYFAPNGTMYFFSSSSTSSSVVQVGGTDTPSPATLTVLPIAMTKMGILAEGAQSNGAAESLILETTGGGTNVLTAVDLTTTPPSPGTFETLHDLGYVSGSVVRGPDGCVYWARGGTIFKVTDTAGDCDYPPPTPDLTLVLTPPSVSPNPAQGTSKTFTATFHYASVPLDTPVWFRVSGANSTVKLAKTTAAGTASFTYSGTLTGTDTVVATAMVGTQTLTSNPAYVTWATGKHTTFCNPNLSPQGGTVGATATLSAALFDASVSPPVAVPGATLTLAAGGRSCPAVTDATGVATCTITPNSAGLSTMTATFASTPQLLGTSCSTGFTVLAPLCPLTPVNNCRTAAPGKASLRLGKGKKSAKTNSFRWKWTSSGNVSLGDLGSPTTTTDYTLCLYDDTGLKMTTRVAAGGTCGRRPCWKPKSTAGNPVGFAYSNRAGTPDGVKTAALTAGSAGKAKIMFSGRGANLPVPTLSLTTPVRLQLHKSGSSVCWDATYSKAGTNSVTAFRAKSD